MVEYYTPDRDELLAAMRKEFAFLVDEYGFTELSERPEQYFNPYSVHYRRPPIEVLVEGISYGFGTTVEFRLRDSTADLPHDQFCLSWITSMRRPDLQEWVFPEKRGQLQQLPKLARELREVADDLLRGDLSIVPKVREAIARAQEQAAERVKIEEFRRAEARSREAFHRGSFREVILELEPHRHVLNRSSRKRLEIAKSRIGRS